MDGANVAEEIEVSSRVMRAVETRRAPSPIKNSEPMKNTGEHVRA